MIYKVVTDFMINMPKGENIIFIDNKTSEDYANKMHKDNFGDLFSLNTNPRSRSYSWHLHVRYVFLRKEIKKYQRSVLFNITSSTIKIWWCYSLVGFSSAFLSILVQTKNYSIFEYFSIHSVSFLCMPKAIFCVIHNGNE